MLGTYSIQSVQLLQFRQPSQPSQSVQLAHLVQESQSVQFRQESQSDSGCKYKQASTVEACGDNCGVAALEYGKGTFSNLERKHVALKSLDLPEQSVQLWQLVQFVQFVLLRLSFAGVEPADREGPQPISRIMAIDRVSENEGLRLRL